MLAHAATGAVPAPLAPRARSAAAAPHGSTPPAGHGIPDAVLRERAPAGGAPRHRH
jgi:hypothetical protein